MHVGQEAVVLFHSSILRLFLYQSQDQIILVVLP
jgi:hypothetical protein